MKKGRLPKVVLDQAKEDFEELKEAGYKYIESFPLHTIGDFTVGQKLTKVLDIPRIQVTTLRRIKMHLAQENIITHEHLIKLGSDAIIDLIGTADLSTALDTEVETLTPDLIVKLGTYLGFFDIAPKYDRTTTTRFAAQNAGAIRKERVREAFTVLTSEPHRLQKVTTIGGVDFINDSKSTNRNSTRYALETIKKPTILIVGGSRKDKENDREKIALDAVKNSINEKVKAIIFLGEDNSKMVETFLSVSDIHKGETNSMEEAVQAAFALAERGDVILLSPGCPSYDLFKDYSDRGNQFTQTVRSL